MFPSSAMQSAQRRDDIRRRESQIGPHDEVPSPPHLLRPSTVMGGMPTGAAIKEMHEDENMDTPGLECVSDQRHWNKAAEFQEETKHGRPSLPSIHSLFGIAGTGAGNESKASSVSDVAQRAGTSASSLMDVFPSPFSEYRNAPEDFSPPPFGNISRLPRLHRHSSTSIYASSSSARDSMSSSISLVTPTTNLTLESGGDELERRESYATFAEEVERRRMSDNLPLGRRIMTLSQADEALRIRMGRNESYPSSAGRQLRQEGKTASSLAIELPNPSPTSRLGFASSSSRPSSSQSAVNGRRPACQSNLAVITRSSSPTPEPPAQPPSQKRSSAETIGPRKRLRSSSPAATPDVDPALYQGASRGPCIQAGIPAIQAGRGHSIAINPLRAPLLNRSESVPHLRHFASQSIPANETGGLHDNMSRLVSGHHQEARPHTVQSATYRDFSSRPGPSSDFRSGDAVWSGDRTSPLPSMGSGKVEARRRLSLEALYPAPGNNMRSTQLAPPFLSSGFISPHDAGIYHPTNARYPPYAAPLPYPFYQPTAAPLFGAGSGPIDPSSDRRASLSASNLEATNALGIPHGVVLTQLPDASTKDRLGNPTVGPRYGCDFCGKTFSRPSSLKIHIYTHTGEKPYICTWPNCNRQFSVQSNLKRHAKVHHEQAGLAGQEVSLNETSEMDDGGWLLHHNGHLEGPGAG